MHPAVAALSLEEKGLVLGAALAHTPPADLEARMPGDAGARCAAALAALADEPRSARAAAIAALTALARAPVPAGIEHVHPDWLRERFEREPAAIVRAVSAGLPDDVRRVAAQVLDTRGGDGGAAGIDSTGPGVAEIQRQVFAGLVPLAGAGAPTTPIARELAALPAAEIVRAIELRGAEALGRSLRGAPATVVARAAASVSEALAAVVLEAARDDGDEGESKARDRAREIVAAAGVAAGGEAAFAIGAHAVAALLEAEGAAAVMAIAQRLPLAAGRRLLAAAEIEA
ncbi:MAG TPA: hypothetical protein VIQ54_33535 [Polyangia bacterium]